MLMIMRQPVTNFSFRNPPCQAFTIISRMLILHLAFKFLVLHCTISHSFFSPPTSLYNKHQMGDTVASKSYHLFSLSSSKNKYTYTKLCLIFFTTKIWIG
ncbi:hypothetical protein TorRG33x02_171310 [Trema orientale]|uniref:Uncharacterized protein n=1 Tax=Trema orientale TaxID=63057 RepID=A0A2P5EN71_TREOI|nr:hypothetical protein TorRG33x02_171310 [Trema orientale]